MYSKVARTMLCTIFQTLLPPSPPTTQFWVHSQPSHLSQKNILVIPDTLVIPVIPDIPVVLVIPVIPINTFTLVIKVILVIPVSLITQVIPIIQVTLVIPASKLSQSSQSSWLP